MGKAIHILRYGTVADKEDLDRSLDKFDWLAINGRTAAYVSKSISRFVVNNFFSSSRKGYFIDPLTYAFQGNLSLLCSGKSDKRKASITALMNEYKGVIKEKIDNNVAVLPTDFNEAEIDNLCHNVLSFQYNLVSRYIDNKGYSDYLEYASDEYSGTSNLKPKFLIAPYFYLDDQSELFNSWLSVNMRMLESSSKCGYDRPVYAQLVISKSMLKNLEILLSVANAYKKLNPAGITLWIDDFSEHEADYDELVGLISLLEVLKPIPVYNMYGGYFSIILTNKDVGLLNGVSHGLEYGEYRQVYPVGGGLPVSKYYYLPLHRRLGFFNAFTLLSETGYIDTSKEDWGSSDHYYSDICDCVECHKLLKDKMVNFSAFDSKEFYVTHVKGKEIRRSKASKETKTLCRYHYMNCKAEEFCIVNEKTLYELITELQKANDDYSSLHSYILGNFEYIRTWISILNKLVGAENGKEKR